MAYPQLEDLCSRKREKVALFLTAENMAGVLAIALPAYQLHTAQPSIDTYPQKLLGTYNRIKVAFPGTEIGATVVLKA